MPGTHACVARWDEVFGTLGPEQVFQIGSTQLRISEDLRKKTRADRFTGVDRNRRYAAIRVAQEMMAATGSGNFEARTFQRRNQVLPIDPKAWIHEAMRTR